MQAAEALEAPRSGEENESAPADAAGTLSFYNLGPRMHEGYYPMLAFAEQIQTLDEIDYEKLERNLRNQMKNIADAQYYMALRGDTLASSMMDSSAAALRSRAGILRYTEEGAPHFISFLREGEAFRFFNVNDGLEDFTCPMEDFFENPVRPPQYVSVFTLEAEVQ